MIEMHSGERDSYRIIVGPSRAETVVLGSRFIADAIPITDENEGEIGLTRIRKEFHAATHHCWAWRIGEDEPATRFSDDGEPAGTAGRPIATALERHDVTNILLVVTRYFGGTKLGTGGLARAYADAAETVLNSATVVTTRIMAEFTIALPYEVLPRVKAFVYKEGSCLGETFGETPTLHVSVPRSQERRIKREITDLARGKAVFGTP